MRVTFGLTRTGGAGGTGLSAAGPKPGRIGPSNTGAGGATFLTSGVMPVVKGVWTGRLTWLDGSVTGLAAVLGRAKPVAPALSSGCAARGADAGGSRFTASAASACASAMPACKTPASTSMVRPRFLPGRDLRGPAVLTTHAATISVAPIQQCLWPPAAGAWPDRPGLREQTACRAPGRWGRQQFVRWHGSGSGEWPARWHWG